jgi:hypothetical protein
VGRQWKPCDCPGLHCSCRRRLTCDHRDVFLYADGRGDNAIDLVHLLSFNHDFALVTESDLSVGGANNAPDGRAESIEYHGDGSGG